MTATILNFPVQKIIPSAESVSGRGTSPRLPFKDSGFQTPQNPQNPETKSGTYT